MSGCHEVLSGPDTVLGHIPDQNESWSKLTSHLLEHGVRRFPAFIKHMKIFFMSFVFWHCPMAQSRAKLPILIKEARSSISRRFSSHYHPLSTAMPVVEHEQPLVAANRKSKLTAQIWATSPYYNQGKMLPFIKRQLFVLIPTILDRYCHVAWIENAPRTPRIWAYRRGKSRPSKGTCVKAATIEADGAGQVHVHGTVTKQQHTIVL